MAEHSSHLQTYISLRNTFRRSDPLDVPAAAVDGVEKGADVACHIVQEMDFRSCHGRRNDMEWRCCEV